jgi:hypothetical protein
MRALGIELIEEKYKIYILDFLARIRTNKFTNDLYVELESMNVKASYSSEINDIVCQWAMCCIAMVFRSVYGRQKNSYIKRFTKKFWHG